MSYIALHFYTFQGVVFAAYPNTPLTSIFSRLFDSLSNDRGDQYLAEVSHVCNSLLSRDVTSVLSVQMVVKGK